MTTASSTDDDAGRSYVSQSAAARLCGCSPSTIRRHREAGRLPGCIPDDDGGWRVPLDALRSAGLLSPDHDAPQHDEDDQDEGQRDDDEDDQDEGEGDDVARLRAALDAERVARQAAETRATEAEHRAQLAQAVADERGRALDAERALGLALTRQVLAGALVSEDTGPARAVVVATPAPERHPPAPRSEHDDQGTGTPRHREGSSWRARVGRWLAGQ